MLPSLYNIVSHKYCYISDMCYVTGSINQVAGNDCSILFKERVCHWTVCVVVSTLRKRAASLQYNRSAARSHSTEPVNQNKTNVIISTVCLNCWTELRRSKTLEESCPLAYYSLKWQCMQPRKYSLDAAIILWRHFWPILCLFDHFK